MKEKCEVRTGAKNLKYWLSLWVTQIKECRRACMPAKSLQLCLTLCDPIGCSVLDSSVHGILQARIPEWAAMPSTKGSSRPRNPTRISCLLHRQAGSLPLAPPGKAEKRTGLDINRNLFTNTHFQENLIYGRRHDY